MGGRRVLAPRTRLFVRVMKWAGVPFAGVPRWIHKERNRRSSDKCSSIERKSMQSLSTTH